MTVSRQIRAPPASGCGRRRAARQADHGSRWGWAAPHLPGCTAAAGRWASPQRAARSLCTARWAARSGAAGRRGTACSRLHAGGAPPGVPDLGSGWGLQETGAACRGLHTWAGCLICAQVLLAGQRGLRPQVGWEQPAAACVHPGFLSGCVALDFSTGWWLAGELGTACSSLHACGLVGCA